ncbi:MAG: Gfo/Idh/MocA family oxidoreductase [Alphaproteobacteria bacterium]|nr:Gfo/Idh/MocA family oxidoreductase [Alphaproteobacteria bacterium]
MAQRLRVAVIGSGIARIHVEQGFFRLGDLFEVPVLCSLDEERGRALTADLGLAEFTPDFSSVLGRDDIDLVDICTPPGSHFELSRAAIAAGKHVICEKPLFGSVAEVDAMAGIVAGSGRTFMPIFQYRYGAGLQKLKHLVDRGLTGKAYMTTIETHWWRPPPYYSVPWRGKWATELGGGLLGHAIHAHDMLNYIHGPTEEVFAYGATLVNPIEVEDNAALALRMRNGSLAALSMTLGSREQISRLRFCFENLVAESIRDQPYAPARDPWRFVAEDAALQAGIDAALAEVPAAEEGFARQFELFHEAVMAGTAPPVTLEDARRSLELVTAAYHSMRTGRPTPLPIASGHPLFRSWLPEGISPASPG